MITPIFLSVYKILLLFSTVSDPPGRETRSVLEPAAVVGQRLMEIGATIRSRREAEAVRLGSISTGVVQRAASSEVSQGGIESGVFRSQTRPDFATRSSEFIFSRE